MTPLTAAPQTHRWRMIWIDDLMRAVTEDRQPSRGHPGVVLTASQTGGERDKKQGADLGALRILYGKGFCSARCDALRRLRRRS